MGNGEMKGEIVPAVSMLPKGQEVATIAAMAASARAVMAAPRTRTEIVRACENLGELYGRDGLYSFPLGGQQIEGINSDLAQAVAMESGNCMVACAVDSENEAHWNLQAVFVNVRTGAIITRPYQQPKRTPLTEARGRDGAPKLDPERARAMVFGIGVSKATRNVIERALPLECKRAFEAAKRIAAGGEKRPAAALDWKSLWARTKTLNITRLQMETLIGHVLTSPDKRNICTPEDYELICGVCAAIEAGETTIEAVLTSREPGSDDAKEGKADDLAS